MRVDLVDALRCVRPHEPTWLVAATARVSGREILDGVLGCPVCHAEFPIRDGIADFAGGTARRAQGIHSDPDAALRLAAMLDLTDARGWVLLLGRWGSLAYELQGVSGIPILLVNPPPDIGAADGVSVVLTNDVLPLAPGLARAAALDPDLPWATEAGAGAVRPGGRVVGMPPLRIPPGVRELARDHAAWVGEREAAPAGIVSLGRRSTRDDRTP